MNLFLEEKVLLCWYGWLSLRSVWAGDYWRSLYWAGAVLITLAALRGLSK